MAKPQPTPLPPLTRRQTEVIRVVRRFVAKHGYPPSLRELAGELGMNHNAVAGHLAAAQRKGAVRRTSRMARAIVLTAAP